MSHLRLHLQGCLKLLGRDEDIVEEGPAPSSVFCQLRVYIEVIQYTGMMEKKMEASIDTGKICFM